MAQVMTQSTDAAITARARGRVAVG